MAVFYVGSSGSDSNGGTDPSSDAWLTLQHALDTVADGSEIRIMSDITLTTRLTLALTSVDSSLPVILVGADSSGDALTSGYRTIDGNSAADSCFFSASGTSVMVIMDRLAITGAVNDGIDCDSAGWFTLRNCRCHNNGGSGLYGSAGATSFALYNTELDNNGAWGLEQSTTSRVRPFIYGGSIHDNAIGGINMGGGVGIISHSLIYDNGGQGVRIRGAAQGWRLTHCTIHGNSDDGIQVDTGDQLHAFGNSIVSNGGYGIGAYAPGTDFDLQVNYAIWGNHYHSNTSGEWENVSGGGNTSTEVDKQTGDPLFASVTDGSEDFTPSASSPLKGNGSNGSDIGAIRADDAAGGGTVVHTF